MRIVQVSDTHISATLKHFKANTEIVADYLAGMSPDLFVHTGDLSMDGAGTAEDLRLARQWNAGLPGEVLSIPGNHDVGDLAANRPEQPVDSARLGRWREIIGPDRWLEHRGGWQLVGLNAMLLGTGLAEEDEQYAWLQSALASDRPIAIFTHKPLCIEKLDEGPRGYWSVPPEPRARLLTVLEGKPVKLIASGHLHVEHAHVVDGIDQVWAGAASFVVGPSQEYLGGKPRLGLVEHVFGEDGVTSRFIRPDGLVDLQLDAVRDEIYPD